MNYEDQLTDDFYFFSSRFLGMTVPSNSDQLLGALKKGTSGEASPFVVAMNLAGIAHFGDVINGSLLIFVSWKCVPWSDYHLL